MISFVVFMGFFFFGGFHQIWCFVWYPGGLHFFFPDGFMVLFDLYIYIYIIIWLLPKTLSQNPHLQPNNFPQTTLIFSSLSQFIKHPVAKKIPERGAVNWESVTRNWGRMTWRAPQWPLTLQPVLLPLKLELGTILPPENWEQAIAEDDDEIPVAVEEVSTTAMATRHRRTIFQILIVQSCC